MAQVNFRLPVILSESDIMFRQLQYLCNNCYKCKKYQEFVKAYDVLKHASVEKALKVTVNYE